MASEDIFRKLYNRFCKDLAEAVADMYYDESELLDIYGYASDNNDDYVCLEVLMLGQRLFPKSEDLAKRKAFFLRTVSPEAFKKFIANRRIPKDDTTWAILECFAKTPEDDAVDSKLHDIVSLRLDEDDDIIQFVALQKSLHRDEWFYENLDFIKSHCEHIGTLFFEMARLAETNDQIERAIPLMEDLTMREPFNVIYWSMLADLQSKIGRYDDALASIDYAKALDINDVNMLGMEGHIYLLTGKFDEAIVALEKAMEIDPTDDWIRGNLMRAYQCGGKSDKYAKIVRADFERFPYDQSLLVKYIKLKPDRIEWALEKYFAEEEPSEETAVLIASELCTEGYYTSAAEALRWYDRNYTLTQYGKFNLLEIMYRRNDNESAYDMMVNDADLRTIPPESLTAVGIMACVLLRSGRYALALQFCEHWIDALDDVADSKEINPLIYRGVYDTLMKIKTLLRNHSKPTKSQIDKVCL